MVKRQTDKIQIPIQVSRFVISNKLEKSFAIFLFFKFYGGGKIHKDSVAFQNAKSILKINDKRTFQKHLNRLLTLTWVRYNPKSGYYFISGFDRIRYENDFRNRQATTLYYYELNKLLAFLVGTLLSAEVNGQKYYWEIVVKRKLKPAVHKRDTAIPAKACANDSQPEYYGVGLPKIMEIFGCKKTRASQLRKLAADAGFIKVKPKFTEIMRLNEADYKLRNFVNEIDSSLKGKIRFRGFSYKGKRLISVLVQTHHEIIPQVKFCTLAKFSNLSIPLPHKKVTNTVIRAAA